MVTRRRAFGHSLAPLDGRDVPRRETLWERREVIGAGALLCVGALALGVCWYGAAGERSFEDGKAWLIGAIVTTAMISGVSALMVMAGFRRLRTEKDETLDRFLRVSPPVASAYLRVPQRSGRASEASIGLTEVGVLR